MRENAHFRNIKKEIRVVGIDDSPFTPRKKGKTDVIGIVFRGGYWIDGVMRTEVEVDGLDATEKIVNMIKFSPHFKQLRIIMLNGITFAGFNIVNIKDVFEETGIPVITLTKEKIKIDRVKIALMNLPNWEIRWFQIQQAGKILRFKTDESELNVQTAGLSEGDAEMIIRVTSTRGSIPEPLRIAHLIASSLGKENQ